MALTIITYPDDRLKVESKPVEEITGEILSFITQLEETMRTGPGGVGIAAPQTGRAIRLAIIDASSRPEIPNHGRIVLINPEITRWEGYAAGREGCMSVPDYTGNVIRAEQISLECLDETGIRRTYEMEGFEARAVQHEIDHLNGLLFLDRLVSRKGDLFRRKVYKKKPSGEGRD